MSRSKTMHTTSAETFRAMPSVRGWFAGGERVGYDPNARAIVAGLVGPNLSWKNA